MSYQAGSDDLPFFFFCMFDMIVYNFILDYFKFVELGG